MSLTVIAIASLHAVPPWIAGRQTKKMRWVAVGTCIACCAAILVGNDAYLITDLLATGIGFFIGRIYVIPRSQRKELRSQAPIGTNLPQNRIVARSEALGLQHHHRPGRVNADTAHELLRQSQTEVEFARSTETVSHSSSEAPAALIDVLELVTQCPYCSTLFRVGSGQLGLRGGIVRCGACQGIFDGRGALQ